MAGSPSSSQPVTFTTAGYRLPAADPAGGGDARTGLPVAAGMLAIADTPTDRCSYASSSISGSPFSGFFPGRLAGGGGGWVADKTGWGHGGQALIRSRPADEVWVRGRPTDR